MDWRAELIAKERALLTRGVRGSAVQLEAWLSAEFREIGSSGACFGLEEVLAHLPRETGWTAEARDIECRALADGVAQLWYLCRIDPGDGGTPCYSWRSSIWRREPQGWRMVFHQGTRIAPCTW